MHELSELEALIYNEGERLIPGVSHDRAEEVRHRSSYVFWRAIIEVDLDTAAAPRKELHIADLGCGVGHGCVTLSKLPGASVVGVDVSAECLDYARAHYARDNIEYVRADLREFIPRMPNFDYVVSRGSMEHVPDGLELTRQATWQQRLMFDVPFAEPVGRNPHHVIHDVTEEAFSVFPNAEVFFQDLAGITFDMARKPPSPNIIICVASRAGLPHVARSLRFPVPAWGGAAGAPTTLARSLRTLSVVRALRRRLRRGLMERTHTRAHTPRRGSRCGIKSAVTASARDAAARTRSPRVPA